MVISPPTMIEAVMKWATMMKGKTTKIGRMIGDAFMTGSMMINFIMKNMFVVRTYRTLMNQTFP